MKRVDILCRSLAAVLIVTGCVRIALTYSVFNHTFDEGAHIAAGVEWLDRGTYTIDPVHPPLARLAVALGPYLAGMRSRLIPEVFQEGNALLYGHGNYQRDLTLARLGVLPFFVAAGWMVWRWGYALDGPLAALAGTFVFTMLPPVLGNAAVATTDMAVTATLPAAVYALSQWLRNPGPGRSVWLGISIALALLSKLSAIVYLPACSIVLCLACWWRRRRDPSPPAWPPWRSVARWLAAAALIAACLIWAAYRFSVAPFNPAPDPARGWIVYLLQVPLPAVEFLKGIRAAHVHAMYGHDGYLLGEYRTHGWWYFFPVVLALKTPLAAFALGVAALLPLRRLAPSPSACIPALCAAAILAAASVSTINLGVRHLLPIYPFLAVTAGFGAARLLRASVPGIVFAAVLLVWLAAASLRAHPDYLASFNELAGGKPERFLVGSDLDWGQDLLRLRQALDQRGVSQVALAYFGSADPARHGIHATPLDPFRPTTGWVAISKTSLYLSGQAIAASRGLDTPGYKWLSPYTPVAAVGHSILLYFIPPSTSEPTPRGATGDNPPILNMRVAALPPHG